ncbi:hypothetical protein Premu_1617 [Hallella multisaccharivorax DSM 17128]|uniref:Uncharacterized protein n=1 Tax=Hallella multisaccharivorax DSM 17128 TaxID=688246 RepID=F8NCJ1_9BACT|nr:hypothetical protein Premu_1617 [Hallella multisaccharivorax DSM 17128]
MDNLFLFTLSRIAFCSSVHKNFFLTSIPFVRVQMRCFQKQLQVIIEFLPRYTEKPHEFTLRHGYIETSAKLFL